MGPFCNALSHLPGHHRHHRRSLLLDRQRKQDKEEPFMLGRLRSATMAAEMVDEMCRAATPA